MKPHSLAELHVHLAAVHRLFPDVHLPEVSKEIEHREVQPLPRLRAVPGPVEAHVHDLNQLEHPEREVAVQRLLRLRAGAREPAADHRSDDVHEPREPPLANLQIPRVAPNRQVGALVKLGDRRVQHAHQERDGGVVLEPAQVRERLELVLQTFLVVQRVLLRLAPSHRGDAVQPGGYERLRDARHVRVQHARRLTLEIRHAADQPGPQREEVIHTRGRPLPRLQRGQRELSHRVDPLLIPGHSDQLG